MSFAAHLAALRSLLADGKNDEAMRYNLTSVIGLPRGRGRDGAGALVGRDGRGRPTLVYDHAATHEINVDPDWRSAGPRSPRQRSCARVASPSPA